MGISGEAKRMRMEFDTKKLADKINNNVNVFIRKVVFDGMKRLVRESPVDTARFKANWSTSINNMGTNIIDKAAANTPKGSLSSPSDFNRSAKGIANYELGQTMYLHNNLQYAVPLEYGSSKQAPKGWIRNTANLMQKKFDEIKGLI